ncbi:MAG: transporter substrate-binding domain-containing protein [Muribaculaceae bacterium]|nr:transporter substrate-binding domain-containing protein [Muribaculaceae bacterium]
MFHRKFVIFITLASLPVTGLITSCNGDGNGDDDKYHLPDTLRVATLYSPLSYFLYRGDTLGYDYTLLKDFAKDKGIEFEITVAPSLDKAVEMLDSNAVHLVAYSIPVTSDFRRHVIPCGPENYTTQVLVQPKSKSENMITDVTELIDRDVWVQPNSKYQQRLENLNRELGGGINIHIIERDTIADEDIVAMVSNHQIPLSIVDSDVARFLRNYYKDIDVSLPLSLAQRSSWGVSLANEWLADSITAWFDTDNARKKSAALFQQYYESSRKDPEFDFYFTLTKGRVSPYDEVFKNNAKRISWDWRLLAAQGFVESRFNNNLESWAGARGIMQVMPSTAEAHGIDPGNLDNPYVSISVATDVLKTTRDILSPFVSDPEELQKFTVAAYNSGVAHILDAIALAKKHNLKPDVWKDNVERALLMKGQPVYYNDSIVKYGYFRGQQTRIYVDYVINVYEHIKKQIPNN